MRAIPCLALLVCGSFSFADPGNPAIDAKAHVANVLEAIGYRAERRLPEREFLALSQEPGTVVLDARSREKFAMLHVEGAINLPFPDIDVESLERLLPDKETRILIYCNNNFVGAPAAMPRKKMEVSLNLSTFATLYSYGYRNIFELEPLLEVHETRLPLSGVTTPR